MTVFLITGDDGGDFVAQDGEFVTHLGDEVPAGCPAVTHPAVGGTPEWFEVLIDGEWWECMRAES